jgi:hypothetical protein
LARARKLIAINWALADDISRARFLAVDTPSYSCTILLTASHMHNILTCMSGSRDDHERVRIQMLDIDHRRMNRMLRRKHPVFALRFSMASRFTDGFWLQIASPRCLCMGYGAGALA